MILPIIFSILSPRLEHYPARDELVNFKGEALLLRRDTTGWKTNAPKVEISAQKAYKSDTNHQETSFREYSTC